MNASACAALPTAALRDVNVGAEVAYAVSAGLLMGAYTYWTRIVEPRRGMFSNTRVIMSTVREAWVRKNMNSGQVAVNTFRDVVHVGTFLATSALLVMFGLLGYAFGQGGGGCPPRAIGGGTCAASAELLTVRVVLLATDFAAVFFSFSMGVRYLNHTSYIINAGSLHGRPVSPELVIAFHRRAYRHWSIGLRCLYFAGPLSLWLFGGLWLLLGVAAWIPAMWGLDHMPPDVGALAAPQGGASDDAGADTGSGGGGGGGGGGKRAVAAGAAAGFVAAAGVTRLQDGGAV